MTQLANRRFSACLSFGLLLIWVAIPIGCGKEQASLFEHDHVTPKHWPSSLSDAAAKIQLQCDSTENKPMTINEFTQLLIWIPEVAAETELSEQEWNEVNSACEAISKIMARDKQITASNRSVILELADKLENVDKMLSERQPAY